MESKIGSLVSHVYQYHILFALTGYPWISYNAGMKAAQKKRPGILIRLYPEDIFLLNLVTSNACTPRENYARRAIMNQVRIDHAKMVKKGGAK